MNKNTKSSVLLVVIAGMLLTTRCDHTSNQTTAHQRCRTDGKGPKGSEIQHESILN